MLPNIVLFEAEDAGGTESLWETDGTASGTFELTDGSPPPLITGEANYGFAPSGQVSLDLTLFNNQVLFAGRTGPGNIGPFTLWTSDGTAGGTVPLTIAGVNSGGLFSATVTPGFTVFGSEVLFRGVDTGGAAGLWMTNGSAAGTHEVTGIAGAAATGVSPVDITVMNTTAVLFNGENAAGQYGLWTTDGTANGTHELTPIGGASAIGLNPLDMTVFNGEVLFDGLDANDQSGLWTTDGSAAGTHEVIGIAGAATTGSGLDPTDMTVFGSKVLFSGIDANGLTGLWVTDGTAGGTHELLAEAAGATAAKDPLGLSPTDLTFFNGKVFFSGFDQFGRKQLWETDGTAAGTQMLTVTTASTGGLNPSNMEIYNGQLLFQGSSQQRPTTLWTTNGTAAGTQEITPISGVWLYGLGPEDLIALTPGSSASTLLTAAPTIAGTAAGQTTTSEAPVRPFAHVTIGDTNVRAIDTLTITLGGTGGTLTDGTGFSGLTTVGAGVYRLLGMAGEITSELDALIFTPIAGAPGTTSTTTFTLSDQSRAGGAPVVNSTASVIDSDPGSTSPPPTAPTIAGTVASQTTPSEAPVRPFAHATIGDANAGATDTLTITLGGKGGTLADGTGFSSLTTVSAGVYRLSGTAAAITSELDALVFTPNAGGPNTTSTTTFTLSDQSSAGGAPVVDSTTSVIDSDPAVAPTIVGTVAGQTTTSEAPVRPFMHATIGDANVGATDTLTITLAGVGGTLAGTGLSGGTGGIYTLSGTAAAITSELDALIFTPTAGAPNTTSTTTFRLSDLSSASGAPVVDSTTSVIDSGDPVAPTVTGDILWQNVSTGQASIWEMAGATPVSGGPVTPNPGPSWTEIGSGDFNKDGHSDLLWQNASTGQASIWEMSGSALIGGGPVSSNPGPDWHAVGTGDFTGDGFSDLLWQNASTGQASIWEMNENSVVGGGPVTPNPGTDWKAVGTGDFNKDGDSDILWQNTSTGQVSIWEMHGNTVVGGGAVTPNPGPAWQAIGTGDFTRDGFSDDILFQNKNTGQVSIWEMDGTSLIGGGPVSANPGTSWHAIGTGAGGSDILLQSTSGQTSIWEMNGNTITGGGPVTPIPGPGWRAVGLT